MEYKYKLGFIGAGNMAKAIASGIIDSNIVPADKMIMSNTSINGDYKGITLTTNNSDVITNCEYIILAVKPQIFNSIKDTLSNINARCVISIMAGVKIDKISSTFNNVDQVVRVMPNTPSAVGLGMSCITNNIKSNDILSFVSSVFNAIGKVEFLDESLFDAVTSISGSGPAYVYYFIKAMIDGGIEGGLTFEQSKALTLQTIVGSCKMVENSPEELKTLIQKVCSKGGTTIQAIDTFNNYEVDKKIIEGINKCRIRSEELSR